MVCGNLQQFLTATGAATGLQQGQQRKRVVLSTIVLSWAYVFLLCPLAKNQGIE